jgi:hypothetical protein
MQGGSGRARAAGGHERGLSRTNSVKSKRQQRYLFAHHLATAHAAAKRGAAYAALPDRARPRAA